MKDEELDEIVQMSDDAELIVECLSKRQDSFSEYSRKVNIDNHIRIMEFMLRYHRYKVIVSLNDDRKEKEEKWKKGKSNS
jgi:hypothetical protein